MGDKGKEQDKKKTSNTASTSNEDSTQENTPRASSLPRVNVKPPGPIDFSESEQSAKTWRLWKQMWANYAIVTKLHSQDNEYQKAMFLCTVGQKALETYNSFQYTADEDPDKLETIIAKYDEHFTGEINETYERFQFNKRIQQSGESFEVYLTELRNMSKTCNFCKCMSDSLVKDQLVLGIKDDSARTRLLQENKLDLKRCIEICRSTEAASTQLGAITGKTNTVSKVDKQSQRGRQYESKGKPSKFHNNRRESEKMCKFCMNTHILKKELCPAWGRRCSVCGIRNHWRGSVACEKKGRVHTVQVDSDEQDSDIESVYTVKQFINGVNCKESNAIMCEMCIESKIVKMQVDCGASVNILPRSKIGTKSITPGNITLEMWNKDKKKASGTAKLEVTNPSTQQRFLIKFVIVEEELTPLLSRKAAERMGLITVNYDKFKSVNALQIGPDQPKDAMTQFPNVFEDGIGTLPGEVRLTLKNDAEPVICPPKRIPVEIKEQVRQELERLVEQGVLAPVDEPTDWVNQMTIATKQSGELRICLDPRALNKALKREHYQLPVLEDTLHDLAQAKMFSKLDLKHGYWHCVLDVKSSLLTTFATPFGRFKWLRLPFGLNVSSEIFQKRLVQALEGLPATICIADDILVYGKGDEEKQAEQCHDANLMRLLHRCQEKGIKLNKGKAVLKTKQLDFMGHLITNEGLKPDPNKVEAITKLKKPTDKQGVERLNGAINYLAKFLPKLSQVMEPIRRLTHKDVEWHWDTVQDRAFEEIKQLVTNAPVLAYYDPQKELVIECDASSKGLGAVLLQEDRPIAYASRCLTDPETRYATIEKEMLAVIFSLEKWHQFTFGRQTKVYTDHQPLVSISQKTLDKAPRRLQGMLLRSLTYNIVVEYRPGKQQVLADMMSRSFLPLNSHESQREFEVVNAVRFLPMKEARIQEIRTHTENDEVLRILRTTIQQGFPENKSSMPAQITPYFHIRDELSVYNGLVFKGERLVIPTKMRADVKKEIHSAHSGIEGCLRRAREHVYWPGMNAEIKEWISTCEACRLYEISHTREPLMNHEIPERPWEKVGIDILTFQENDYLVTVDYHSNYWELDRLENTKASTTIRKLKAHFARYGIPSQLISDNGPQFKADIFRKFTQDWDIEHKPSAPYNSRSNGKAESAVKAAKNMLRKTHKTGQDQYLALLAIRNTPSQGIGRSPAQRLMNRRTRTLLPTTDALLHPRTADKDTEMTKIKSEQDRQAFYYNRKARNLPSLKEGDNVRMKPFIVGDKEWRKATVKERLDERSYQVETKEGNTYRRNRIHLRNTKETAVPAEMTEHADTDVMTGEEEAAKDHTDKPNAEKNADKGSEESMQNNVTTRSGRIVKRPAYLNDYAT